MKNIHILILALLFVSCTEPKYTHIGQEIINGKVSATKKGKKGGYGHPAELPIIWVQNSTTTQEVEIPFEYENRWKVGDSCLLIIEKYKENDTK
tara:strand:+ start:12438 stop:12719 length:282 start_codon:yes stop_codon:yes gene_type:complete